MEEDRSVLKPGEPHPSAASALKYINSIDPTQLSFIIEAVASCAIENNRTAEICLGTLNRLQRGLPVSDRYLLGLAWFIKELNRNDNGRSIPNK